MGWEQTASGYAGVWATENTREALFDAMKRRETYATTGPRMIVRFFGGWDFEPNDANNRMPARVGYTKGVPMGAIRSLKQTAGADPARPWCNLLAPACDCSRPIRLPKIPAAEEAHDHTWTSSGEVRALHCIKERLARVFSSCPDNSGITGRGSSQPMIVALFCFYKWMRRAS